MKSALQPAKRACTSVGAFARICYPSQSGPPFIMRDWFRLLILGAIFFLTNCAIWLFAAGIRQPWLFAVCCLTGFGTMLLARVCAQPERRFVVLFVFSVAVGSRIIAFAAPPLLSDDLHRYLWDGKLLASGINPYDYRPLDPALQPFHDEHFNRLNSRHWYSVYPPLMQV